MIKNRYTFLQQSCCSSPANFNIYESQSENKDNDTAISETQMFHNTPIGKFTQSSYSNFFICCSCRPIQNLKLSMYDQNLSLSSTYPQSCCSFPGCAKELVVMTEHKIMIGKIIRKISCCCGSYDVFLIQNNEGKVIYKLRNVCCQAGNFFPAWLRCCGSWDFEIVDEKDEVVGKIENVYNGCGTEFLTFQDKFEIELPRKAESKDRILILNAVVYLNQFFFEFF